MNVDINSSAGDKVPPGENMFWMLQDYSAEGHRGGSG